MSAQYTETLPNAVQELLYLNLTSGSGFLKQCGTISPARSHMGASLFNLHMFEVEIELESRS